MTKPSTRARRISLRPYNGNLYFATSRSMYEREVVRLFGEHDKLNEGQQGRFFGGCGPDHMWTYLVWAANPHSLAHEMSHVVLHVFERCGIDPREANGEPFCYMLSQVIMEAQKI